MARRAASVRRPSELPSFEPSSASEVDSVLSKLSWWPHRLLCADKGTDKPPISWQLGPCKLGPNQAQLVCSFLPPLKRRQLARHLAQGASRSVLRRTYAIAHACLEKVCDWTVFEETLYKAYLLLAQDIENGIECFESALSFIESISVVRYAPRSYCRFPAHVTEILGQLSDGCFFYFQDVHPKMDEGVEMTCSVQPIDESEGDLEAGAVDYAKYKRILPLDLRRLGDCFVVAVSPDLQSLLLQLDRRVVEGLVQAAVGRSVPRLCSCEVCEKEAFVSKWGLRHVVQLFNLLAAMLDRLHMMSEGLGLAEPTFETSGLSVTDREMMECALERLEECEADLRCHEDVREVQEGLRALLEPSEAEDAGWLRRVPGVDRVQELAECVRALLAKPLCRQQRDVEALAFTEASCGDVFTAGPYSGHPLTTLLDALKAGGASTLGVCDLNAVQLQGKLWVMGSQQELWCMKRYAEWRRQQDDGVLGEPPKAWVWVWPLAPNVPYFDHSDVLQHFRSVASTQCAGRQIELEPTAVEASAPLQLAPEDGMQQEGPQRALLHECCSLRSPEEAVELLHERLRVSVGRKASQGLRSLGLRHHQHHSFYCEKLMTCPCVIHYEGPQEDVLVKIFTRDAERHDWNEWGEYTQHGYIHAESDARSLPIARDGPYFLGIDIHRGINREWFWRLDAGCIEETLGRSTPGGWRGRGEVRAECKAAEADYILSRATKDGEANDRRLRRLVGEPVRGAHGEGCITFCTDRSLGMGQHFAAEEDEVKLYLGRYGFGKPASPVTWIDEYLEAARTTRHGMLVLSLSEEYFRSAACRAEVHELEYEQVHVYNEDQDCIMTFNEYQEYLSGDAPDLCQAVDEGDMERVEGLLRDRPSAVHDVCRNKLTALGWLAFGSWDRPVQPHRQISIADALLRARSNMESQDHQGNAPLHLAARAGFTQVVRKLLRDRADVHARNFDGVQPLHLAAEYGRTESSKWLLRARADVNVACMSHRSHRGASPLHLAAKWCSTETVELLVCRRAELDALDCKGKTALSYAESCKPEWSWGQADTLRCLREQKLSR